MLFKPRKDSTVNSCSVPMRVMNPDNAFTDDAGLIEAMGVPVKVIEGHAEAMKITRPFDLAIAETIIAKRRASGSVT